MAPSRVTGRIRSGLPCRGRIFWRKPGRAVANPAHAYLAAPYGIYQTQDGHIALAMNDLARLSDCLGLGGGLAGLDPFRDRERIGAILAAHLSRETNAAWLARLVDADMWAAPVMDWPELLASGVLDSLGMIGGLSRGGADFRALLSPLRLDGRRASAQGPAPRLGGERIDWAAGADRKDFGADTKQSTKTKK